MLQAKVMINVATWKKSQFVTRVWKLHASIIPLIYLLMEELHVERIEVKDILKGFDYKSFVKFAVQFQESQFRNIRLHKEEQGFVVDLIHLIVTRSRECIFWTKNKHTRRYL